MDRATGWTVVAIVVGLAVALVVLWWAAPGPSTDPCHPSGSGNTPLGGWLAWSPPSEASAGSDHWYNFTVQSGLPSLHLGNLNLHVETSAGTVVAPGVNWTLTVWNVTGPLVGVYSFVGPTAGNWTTGGGFPLYSGEIFSLLATPNPLSGDSFNVVVSGSSALGCPVAGAVSVTIP